MMFLDLICDNNYINMNIKLAKIAGLNTAVYFAELLNIIREVERKKKFDENGFFKLDRKYLEDRTTLATEDQLNCDAVLCEYNIMNVNPENPNLVRVNLEVMAQMISGDNLDEYVSAKKKAKVSATQKAANKKAGQVITMCRIADEAAPVDLQPALHDWVDAIYANKKFLTRAIIEDFVGKICNASVDTTERINLIKAAMVSSYTNADWVINSYRRDHKTASTLPTQVMAQVDPSAIKYF